MFDMVLAKVLIDQIYLEDIYEYHIEHDGIESRFSD